ncbi:hypothetical protein FKM82_024872 [Ascaphus truei]
MLQDKQKQFNHSGFRRYVGDSSQLIHVLHFRIRSTSDVTNRLPQSPALRGGSSGSVKVSAAEDIQAGERDSKAAGVTAESP